MEMAAAFSKEAVPAHLDMIVSFTFRLLAWWCLMMQA
jgi:hypothetical protein